MSRPVLAVTVQACALLAGCATAPAGDDLSAYPATLTGVWSNAVQYGQAPDDLKHPPAGPEDDWLDRQTVTFTPAPAPAPGALALRAEWRGDADARTETWVFRRDDAAVRLEILAEGAATRPGCALTVSGSGKGAWNAQTDPERCTVDTARGAAAVDTRVTVMPTGILFQTSAQLPDGAYTQRRPGGPPYDLRRVP